MKKKTGYGCPPKSGQFKPGQSGNPKGRPKKSKNFMTLFHDELGQKILITENGRQKEMTKMEAMIKRMVNGSLQGEPRSILTVIDILKRTDQLSELDAGSILPENYEEILGSFVEREAKFVKRKKKKKSVKGAK